MTVESSEGKTDRETLSAERQAFLAALLTMLFWSSAFSGIRAALTDYGPYHLSLIRFLTASAVFGVYALLVRMPLPRSKDWPYLLFLGFFGISVYHTCLNIGEQTVPAGTASLVIATVPVLTAALSRFALGEYLSGLGWVGLLVSLLGVAVMTLGGGGETGFAVGVLFVVVAALGTTIYFVYAKPMFARYRPVHLTAYVTWAGTLPLLLFLPGLGEAVREASFESTAAAVYIGVFPAAVAYASWSVALSKTTASKATSFLYLNPPLAILFGWIWLKEAPGWSSLFGGMLALAGVYIVHRYGKAGAEEWAAKRAARAAKREAPF